MKSILKRCKERVRSKDVVIFHPYVFAIYPITAAISRNVAEIRLGQVLRPLGLTLFLAILLFALISKLAKPIDRAGLITSLLLLFFFDYGYYYKLPETLNLFGLLVNRHFIIIFFWVSFIYIITSKSIWSHLQPHRITIYLNILSLIFLFLPRTPKRYLTYKPWHPNLQTKHLYNLEATPAESTSYRFALRDQQYCPGIKLAGSKETPYLTNSTQLPVDYTDDLWEALKRQDDLQTSYTGGTIFHIFLGEEMDNWKQARTLVQKVAESTKMPYFTVTPTFSVCMDHGRLKGKVEKCPKCGKETEVYSRIVGYLRPISRWNKGKDMEFRERKTFKV